MPPRPWAVLRGGFRAAAVPAVRRTVAQYARSCGLSPEQVGALELVARRRPDPARDGGGRGVDLAQQLCDLVQVRSTLRGTTVRVTTWR